MGRGAPAVNPLLVLGLIALALAVLAYTKQIYPHRIAVVLGLFPAVISVGLILGPQWTPWVIGFDAALLGLLLADLVTVPPRKWFDAQRELGRIASLQKPHPVKLTIGNRSRRPMQIWVRDDVPEGCHANPEEFGLRLPPRSRSSVHYELEALRRGAFQMEAVYLRVKSRLGFWRRYLSFPAENALNVYPDMRQLREYSLLARTDRLSLVGMRRVRRIGQDNEFERLRDYTLDDNYKHIDWRSTARRGKLTVKDFQVNQSQRVLFLVDCGRMMTNTAQGISLLDHALNAMLMLSYVALNKGDSVGLLCFADEIQRFVPPQGGMNQMNQLLHASFDRFPHLVESRYDQAFLYLNSRCRKRSLVILITNVIDEVNSHQVGSYLIRLVGRHLPLGVLLRDHSMFDAASVQPGDDRSLFQAAAANEIIAWRRGVLADMERQGVLALDVFPEQMTAPLVNRYLEIKARHLL
ncbi:MAG: DUF58 domain-containing protein [Planctomycetia bacterium]|nr:DUF58 domain-containing protein [Planctomycetia bacterium]